MLDDYQDLIDELLQTPSLFREWLTANPVPEAVRLAIGLRDRDRVMLSRIERLRSETAPHLSGLPPVTPAAELEPVDSLLESFDTARGDLVSLLMNLTLKEWERQATHDDGGYVTLAEEVEDHVETDEELVRKVRFLAS
jgi:hypothetical protein